MHEHYIKCIDRFCAGEVKLSNHQLVTVTPFCMRSTKSIDIASRNYRDEFIPLMFHAHFDTKTHIYRMKHTDELERGYDAWDTTNHTPIQIKNLYDGKFWRMTSFTPSVDSVESSINSVALGIVRKHYYSYTKTNILAHIPLPKDICDDIGVERLIDSVSAIFRMLHRNGNTITITAQKPYGGTRIKAYKRKMHSRDTIIRLIGK